MNNTAYCIYSFSPPEFDRVKIMCVCAKKEDAKEAMVRFAEVFEGDQFFMEPVIFKA